MKTTEKLLKSTEDQIRIKELRINKLKSGNEFKKCEDVSSELRALLKEKVQLDAQIAVLERKESKSKWYKKRKSYSESKSKRVTSDHVSGDNPVEIDTSFTDNVMLVFQLEIQIIQRNQLIH